MNEAKRWYCQIYGGVCEAHSGSEVIDLDKIDVDFVKASDYDAAQSELATLREELSTGAILLQHWVGNYGALQQRFAERGALLNRVLYEVKRTISCELRDDIDAALKELNP